MRSPIRIVLSFVALSFGIAMLTRADDNGQARLASGVKVGEITERGAVVWARVTQSATRNVNGTPVKGRFRPTMPQEVTVPIATLENACPGAAGRLRVRIGQQADLSDAVTTDWVNVTAETDFSHQFPFAYLKPATHYHFAVETADTGKTTPHGERRGQFRTAPAKDSADDVTFCVTTCQAYHDRDHDDGHEIYASMRKIDPHFVAFAGDNVYYDSEEPRANSPELARYHWQRMLGLPRPVELLRNTGSYWMKDDHDTVKDDCWPGQSMGKLTFVDGQRIFQQQTPHSDKPYRTFRWGKMLQVWLVEGRDFRSPNNMKDGPDKSIWGREQKEWLKRTLESSDASWRVLLTPTPILGPDRGNKADNHSNMTFKHEGDELRAWFQKTLGDNFFIACGDRHWQYHSVDPKTGVQEFSVGPASDAHAGGTPGEDPDWHRFHRVKGGFLKANVRRDGNQSVLRFDLCDVHGQSVYHVEHKRPLP